MREYKADVALLDKVTAARYDAAYLFFVHTILTRSTLGVAVNHSMAFSNRNVLRIHKKQHWSPNCLSGL
jgi:hypothetical protein